jgi:hypothetical protein
MIYWKNSSNTGNRNWSVVYEDDKEASAYGDFVVNVILFITAVPSALSCLPNIELAVACCTSAAEIKGSFLRPIRRLFYLHTRTFEIRFHRMESRSERLQL